MGSLGSSHRLVPVDRVTCCTRRELLLVWWLVVRVLSQRGISAASAPLKLDDHCSCLSSLWSSAVLSARRVSGHFYTACIPARGCRWDKRRVRGTIETRGSGENSIMNALRFPSPFFFFFFFFCFIFGRMFEQKFRSFIFSGDRKLNFKKIWLKIEYGILYCEWYFTNEIMENNLVRKYDLFLISLWKIVRRWKYQNIGKFE